VSGAPAPFPAWEQLGAAPAVAGVMRRYLEQVACVLRPRSVENADQALRCFAGFLAEAAPQVTCLSQVTRRHIEAYKPWLAARPGQNKPRLTPATIAHRLGTLRMFFLRIEEWGWEEAPPKVPMFPGDLPRQDHPLPKGLDDGAAARLLRAAQADRRMLVRVTVEVLLRTGLRVSEFTGLPAGAVVLIGAGPWLHVPVPGRPGAGRRRRRPVPALGARRRQRYRARAGVRAGRRGHGRGWRPGHPPASRCRPPAARPRWLAGWRPACGSAVSVPGWPSPSPRARSRDRRSRGSASRTTSPVRRPGWRGSS
jgi:hypothetical protein